MLSALSQGAPQVLGTPFDGGEWMREESIQFLTGARPWPHNDTNRWGLFRNPLPPASEHGVFRDIREDAGSPTKEVVGPRYDDLSPSLAGGLPQRLLRCSPSSTIRSCGASCAERDRCWKSAACSSAIGVVTHPRDGDGLPASLFDGAGRWK